MQSKTQDSFPERAEEDEAPVGIVELWRLLWRNKFRIMIPAIVLTFITGLLVIRSPDIYTAEAQILLSRGNLEIVELDSTGGIEVTPGEISNALTILGSRNLALQVMERLDLMNDPEINPNLSQPEDADEAEIYPESVIRQLVLDWLGSVVQLNILPGSNVILIRATTTSPGKSAAIANSYVDAYLDYQMRRSQSETERAAGALATRVNELRLLLEDDQELLQNYRAGPESSVVESANALAGEAGNIRARLRATEDELAQVLAARDALALGAAGDIDALRAAIMQSSVLSRLAQATLARPVEAESVVQDVEALNTALQTELSRLEQLRDALSNGLVAIERRMSEANAFTVGLRQLEVEVETTSQVYESSLARLKELSMQTGLRDAGAQILARAEAPLRADAQGRRRMVAIAAVLGLFIGIAHVLIREAANDRVRKASELFGLTRSDTVIQLPAAKGGLYKRRHNAPLSEGIRALRNRLITDAETTKSVIAAGIFSGLPGEGKSMVTEELAKSFALINRRVIVVDGDMRLGSLSKNLGMAKELPGLREVLSNALDPADVIVPIKAHGFDLMPNGQSRDHPGDLLESALLVELIEALRDRYDVILFDTPPVLLLPDATKIAGHMTTHVLVVDYDRSPRSAVKDAAMALHSTKSLRPLVAFCNAPDAFGRNYIGSDRAFARYWS